jgi:ribose transport system ATP-binding protein
MTFPPNEVVQESAAMGALTIERVSKRFGATHALAEVSFVVSPGRVHGLLGGNGSGKSTLIKILAGIHSADTGRIGVGEEQMDAGAVSPELAWQKGLRFVHQNPGVFPSLTVAENIAIGVGPGFPQRFGSIRWRVLSSNTQTLLDRFEIAARPDDALGSLRPAEQTMVAIARALNGGTGGTRPSILVLDEPTASLPEHEVKVLLDALRRYANTGVTIVYVTHRLEEALSIIDSCTVLRDGRSVLTRSSQGLTKTELIEHILGRSLPTVAKGTGSRAGGETVLRVTRLRGGPLRDISFVVRRGEIVGIAGLLGSGRTELLRMIFGALRPEAGKIELAGRSLAARNPRQAMREGIAYIPEDRDLDGAFPDMDVAKNLSIAHLEHYSRRGRLRQKDECADGKRAIAEFAIRAEGVGAPLASLSGGNQQKVVLARWLRRDPLLLLLDEPTQGVDVGARADVYASVRRATARGMAVVLITSDFEEMAQVADRVLVLNDGRLRSEVHGPLLSAGRLTELVHSNRSAA